MAIKDDAPLFGDFEEISAVWWLDMGESMLDDNEYGLAAAVINAASSKYTPEETLAAIRAVVEADVRDYVSDAGDEIIMAKSSDEELKTAVLDFMRKAYLNLKEQLGA